MKRDRPLLDVILATLDDAQGDQIVLIELAGKTAIADHMVIVSGRSSRHVVTLAEKVVEALKAAGRKHVPVEGRAHAEWVLVDAGDVIVHVFKPETRAFYNIEKMWGMPLPESERAAELIA